MRLRWLAWALGGAAAMAACTGGGGGGRPALTKDSARTDTAAVGAAGDTVRAFHTVLFVGTSLTAGLGLESDSAFPALIQEKIDSAGLPFRTINAGVSGETSAGALQRIGWLLRQPFDVMVLETGANDGLRGTPPAETRANIQAIIDSVRRARPQARIVLVQMEALPNLGERYTHAFHETFPLLAERNHLTLLPFLLDSVAGHPALVQGDGLHPNDAGERIVARNVWRGLEPVLREMADR